MPANLAYLDPDVEHVGIAKLRTLNKRTLKALRKSIVVHAPTTNESLAVIIPYESYLELQRLAVLGYHLERCEKLPKVG